MQQGTRIPVSKVIILPFTFSSNKSIWKHPYLVILVNGYEFMNYDSQDKLGGVCISLFFSSWLQ